MDYKPNQNAISELLDIKSLFARYGIDQLPPERQEKIEKQISDLFEKRVSLRVMTAMTEDQKKKAEGVSDDDFYSFLENEGIDFGAAMVAEAAEFGGELIEYLSYVKGLMDGRSSK